jgi:hypothetical protein
MAKILAAAVVAAAAAVTARATGIVAVALARGASHSWTSKVSKALSGSGRQRPDPGSRQRRLCQCVTVTNITLNERRVK